MKTWTKTLVCIALFFGFLMASVGYATLTDVLSIGGTANIEAIDFNEIVITDVTAVAGTTVGGQSASTVFPTNVKSTITGGTGQQIVYQITARNFSDSTAYILTGTTWAPEFDAVAGKLDISVSADAGNTQPLPLSSGANWVQGNPIYPGEEVVFYATYVLTGDISNTEMLVHYSFAEVAYTVTYLNNNETYAVDCITDNSVAYAVRTDAPQNGTYAFAGWVNANMAVVTSYPAGNTNDYTLSAKWDNVYLILFADADGSVIYQENFTDSSTALSAEGQAIVDAKLAELNAANSQNDITVSWSDYDIASATGDITVRAVYNYSGYLNLVPVDEEPQDGIIDYYKVMAVDSLPATVRVPGNVGGIPVKHIERITNVDGESDWDNYENTVTKIIIEEGVESLGWNALAYTPNLAEVELPSTIQTMDKNVFSRNDVFGNDKKTLTITFNGTMAEWKAILANSNEDWDGGLKEGTVVKCTDGYFALEKAGFFSSLQWAEKSY